MFKKIILFALAILVSINVFAQRKKVNEASKHLDKVLEEQIRQNSQGEIEALQKAKAAIDEGIQHESVANNAKAWLTKASVYIKMQEYESFRSENPYQEGINALNKAFELDKKLESNHEAINLISNAAFYLYNDGILTYNKSDYTKSYTYFEQIISFLGNEKDKRFESITVIDTIRSQAKLFKGYNAFYGGEYDKAILALNIAKADAIAGKDVNVYLILSQAYEKKGDASNQLKTIQEGRKLFPSDKNIANAEINYYVASGQTQELIQKLEVAEKEDPTNPDYPFNLGILYANLARPTDGSAIPNNAAELAQKAETYYNKALGLAGDNPTYNYQLGAYFFNSAADVNNEMNKLGTSREEIKKYDEMMKERNALFAKATPLLEKSVQTYKSMGKTIDEGQKVFYFQALDALSNIYGALNNDAKYQEYNKLKNDLLESTNK